jgi:hypothetical protein
MSGILQYAEICVEPDTPQGDYDAHFLEEREFTHQILTAREYFVQARFILRRCAADWGGDIGVPQY